VRKVYELLNELTAIPGVSGNETRVREFIIDRLKLKGKCRVDSIGNLMVEIGKGEPHVALVAHMDEVGLIITKIEEDGSLRFNKIGGIDDRILLSRRVEISTSKGLINGVIGIKPPHLMTSPEERKTVLSSENLRIDVGTRSRKETERLGIRVLDFVTFTKGLIRLGKDLVSGRALDDRVGCAVLMSCYERLDKKKVRGKLTFSWSTQEEMGLRGAKVIAHTLRPDYVIVIDTCSSGDAPGIDGHLQPAMLGSGPVIRYLDSRSIASPFLRDLANKTASGGKIGVQEVVAGGATDATAVQETGSAVLPIGVAMRYTHSTTEAVSLSDIGNTVELVLGIVDNLCMN